MTTTYNLEHKGLNNGWELDGVNIQYGPHTLEMTKEDTLVFNFLGSAYNFSYEWAIKVIDANNFSNLSSPVINGPSNSLTGTATFIANTGAIPAPGDIDFISVRYEDSGGDAIGDGEESLGINISFSQIIGDAPEKAVISGRHGVVKAVVEALKKIDGSGEFLTNLDKNVSKRLLFWDEVTEFPAVHLNAGSETKEYQAGGYEDRFFTITLRCYVQEEDAVAALDALLEDVETVLENNSRLEYKDNRGKTQYTQQMTILSIDTDEGVLEPLGVGEMTIEVRY